VGKGIDINGSYSVYHTTCPAISPIRLYNNKELKTNIITNRIDLDTNCFNPLDDDSWIGLIPKK
jgi:hypothetical protein